MYWLKKGERRFNTTFKIYLKDNIGNMFKQIDEDLPKQFTTQSLQISNGLLSKGNYKIPVEHILFIQEV